ncbi:radical SAM protein [Skermanella mucosa]|uniref:4Fe-4S cluster-binding domain-containing protein n=1 Tax=Skermanella mucosa TaxID=1789672 RepID=UPI00192AAB01|nr:4Fe-4S cluster-binding domain-containing protein [Skermanella mucosa]UEM19411.1 radical SAM protein [Skermanella mucosa]
MTDLSNQTVPPENSRPENSRNVAGRIHSVSALGTGAGGPGVRFVIFLDGCPLRCAQCTEGPSPDSADAEPGDRAGTGEIDALMHRIARYADYMQVSGGGVTVAGAEPLEQAAFIRELFRRCRDMGIATALDTCGGGNLFAAKGLLHLTDLVVLDLTPVEPGALVRRPSGSGSTPGALRFAGMLRAARKPVWVRFAVVPGVNDDPRHVETLAEFAASLPDVERVEVLPFHRLATIHLRDRCPSPAIRALGPPSARQVRTVRNIFRSRGLRAC